MTRLCVWWLVPTRHHWVHITRGTAAATRVWDVDDLSTTLHRYTTTLLQLTWLMTWLTMMMMMMMMMMWALVRMCLCMMTSHFTMTTAAAAAQAVVVLWSTADCTQLTGDCCLSVCLTVSLSVCLCVCVCVVESNSWLCLLSIDYISAALTSAHRPNPAHDELPSGTQSPTEQFKIRQIWHTIDCLAVGLLVINFATDTNSMQTFCELRYEWCNRFFWVF